MVNASVTGFEDWRRRARRLLGRGVHPGDVVWHAEESQQSSLPFGDPMEPDEPHREPGALRRVPRAFLTLALDVACHRNTSRWDRLYRFLWRLEREGHDVLELATDPDVQTLTDMGNQVRRDEHKMRAFVRFTPVAAAEGTRYVAWYDPDHLIVRRAAPFFADRFGSMRWSILTPDLCAHWDLKQLSFSEGVATPPPAATGDIEELWRTYYTSVFNPARANLRATLKEMPLRRWARLPEAAAIPSLLRAAREGTERATRARASGSSARAIVPAASGLDGLRTAASACTACPLHAPATQVVFGEGPRDARLVLVGEQPGDAEDLEGRPFVGPAGGVLDSALAAARIDRASVYLTNAVKHFSFEPRGKRRIHQTPRMSEMRACRPWLEAELQAIRPGAVVCLGSTAARALLGPQARVMELRGRSIEGTAWADSLVVTVHPSAVLRSDEDGPRYFAMLVQDLALAAGLLSGSAGAASRVP